MLYQKGVYNIKVRGRGICRVNATKAQIKALYELMELQQLELESIELVRN